MSYFIKSRILKSPQFPRGKNITSKGMIMRISLILTLVTIWFRLMPTLACSIQLVSGIVPGFSVRWRRQYRPTLNGPRRRFVSLQLCACVCITAASARSKGAAAVAGSISAGGESEWQRCSLCPSLVFPWGLITWSPAIKVAWDSSARKSSTRS